MLVFSRCLEASEALQDLMASWLWNSSIKLVMFESNCNHCLGRLSTLHREFRVVVPSWETKCLLGDFFNFPMITGC
jgi:hypothetical protein